MLQVLNELDHDLIREKYMLKENERGFKYFGSKRKEMNEVLDEISDLEQ
jgi:hypothetical protein